MKGGGLMQIKAVFSAIIKVQWIAPSLEKV